MKPTKNKVFCKDCERTKMLFESEKKAENFIKFNKEEIKAESGYSPERSYYCLFCCGWHITSIKEKIGISKKEKFLEEQKIEKTIIKHINKIDYDDLLNNKIKDFENQLNEYEQNQKENFIEENINKIKDEIETLTKSNKLSNKEILKENRQYLELLYLLRKKYGFNSKRNIKEELKDKEIEKWRIWSENKSNN
jgi:hypothetical protein